MMHSRSHSWNAVLSFSTAYASTADLVNMAQITDLVALEINNETPVNKNTIAFQEHTSTGMDDSLVHSWLQGVQSSGQFQRLQVLRLYEQKGLTSKVFWMLERFPQLKVVVLYRCEEITRCLNQKLGGSKRALLQNGWLIRRFDHLPSGTQEECIVRHLGPLFSMYRTLKNCGRSDGQGAHPTQTPPSPRCPVLEFAIPHLDYADSDKISRRARYAAKSIFIVTRSGESHPKRQAPVEERQPRDRGKRVMRQQGSKNAMDVLNDFLAM
ncbi:hypothetical protein N7539_007231 [Penicillium diatomitis]|uniref:Uncharacterized protein n=1 Tax=Penicillium diatomitis TaxID=2819901 RepID=A0A9W9WUV3_9EURO|nr:uncharacterized protein N7539_007231 [Penicillium diatomitis]KAJ5477087.1 hypothetical protein N7539_007231 [Penicillium diatomitis]